MIGVLANPLAIIMGACLGLFLGKSLSTSMTHRIEFGLGFCIVILGTKMALKFENALVLTLCIGLGGLIGGQCRLDERIKIWILKIQQVLKIGGNDRFTKGFLSASTLYCTGAMAIVGAIQSGTTENHEILLAKALLDGILSISFASVYGIGVLFSFVPVLIYQGSIAAVASKLNFFTAPTVLNELSGVGGVLLMMVGVNLTGAIKIPVIEFLPALPLVLVTAFFMVHGLT